MTDNEIIKALECLSGNSTENGETECAQCCFNSAYCVMDAAENALDLINRQKAEIDRMKKNEKLIPEAIKSSKSDAIKEFAEMLKEWVNNPKNFNAAERTFILQGIDKILKDMLEG